MSYLGVQVGMQLSSNNPPPPGALEQVMYLKRSNVTRIIKRLPLSDSLASLDFMARTLWESPEYDINELGYWGRV
jgi:hypothetical protein